MRREYHKWHSQRLGRQMELLVFGDRGAPTLAFPPAGGRFFDWEDFGMLRALTVGVDQGTVQLFCVDSVDNESWLRAKSRPHDRVQRQLAFDSYLLEEVVPLISGLNQSGTLCCAGCGMGGYQAFNFTLRHPVIASTCILMSGQFDMRRYMDGYSDRDFINNNPVEYLPNTTDATVLEQYLKIRFVVASGSRDSHLHESLQVAELLASKGVPHWLDVWPTEGEDGWHEWHAMAAKYMLPLADLAT